MEIYQPKDSVAKVKLYKQLMDVQMKSKDDPKTLFEQVALIQNWYNNSTKKVQKDQLVAVILKAALVEYAAVLMLEQQKQGSNLAIVHLRVAMNKYYCAVYKLASQSMKDDEMSLMQHEEKHRKSRYNKGQGNKKKFTGNCHCCGKKGQEETVLSGEINAAQTDGKKSEELQLANNSWANMQTSLKTKMTFTTRKQLWK